MKGNNTIPIGGELESKATNKVVVSAEGVRDYKRGKSQEQVNDEVLGNYNILTALYEALDKSDLIITEDHTEEVDPQTNTIYREQGDTSYIDWMWDGVAWRQMAEYNNAIDDVPTANSNNLVKSSGVKQALKELQVLLQLLNSYVKDTEQIAAAAFNDLAAKIDGSETITERVEESEEVIAAALNDLRANAGLKTVKYDENELFYIYV